MSGTLKKTCWTVSRQSSCVRIRFVRKVYSRSALPFPYRNPSSGSLSVSRLCFSLISQFGFCCSISVRKSAVPTHSQWRIQDFEGRAHDLRSPVNPPLIHLVSIYFYLFIFDFSHWRILTQNRPQRKHPGSTTGFCISIQVIQHNCLLVVDKNVPIILLAGQKLWGFPL